MFSIVLFSQGECMFTYLCCFFHMLDRMHSWWNLRPKAPSGMLTSPSSLTPFSAPSCPTNKRATLCHVTVGNQSDPFPEVLESCSNLCPPISWSSPPWSSLAGYYSHSLLCSLYLTSHLIGCSESLNLFLNLTDSLVGCSQFLKNFLNLRCSLIGQFALLVHSPSKPYLLLFLIGCFSPKAQQLSNHIRVDWSLWHRGLEKHLCPHLLNLSLSAGKKLVGSHN